jgi:putative transposon-encoded protein
LTVRAERKKEVTILGSKGKIGEPKKQLKWG